MIVPDINLLLYAYDADSPFHKQAAGWWEQCLSGTETVGLAPVVLFGFLRIAKHARVFRNPLPPAEAAEHIPSWLAQLALRCSLPRIGTFQLCSSQWNDSGRRAI